MSELLGYEELAELTGRSVGALRVARSKGRLPEQDAPGPRWRRESLAGFLAEGAPVPAADRSEPATAPPVAPRPPFSGEDAEDRRRRAMTIAEILACPHPADDRKVTGYMTMCVVCGRRMEGRESWTGGGYAAWTPGWREHCPHPAAERRSHPWGTQCGVCGSGVR